jgi:mRNA interferase MazF
MIKGDVYWINFKTPDKKRPALILTRSSAIKNLNAVTVAPITTTIRENPVCVWADETDGLEQESVINLDNIQTVSKQKVGTYITHLSEERMNEVFEAIKFAFDFE